MIRIPGLRAPLDAPPTAYPRLAAQALGLPPERILTCRLSRRSVDARKRDDVHFILTLDVTLRGDEAAALARARLPQASLLEAPSAAPVFSLSTPPRRRPVVVGLGPAGLFAALTLARAGARPLVLERGRDVERRRRDVEAFWTGGPLDPASNVQFGEGGAGAFSDGKLNTGIKDPRCRGVLEDLAAFGAPEEILWEAKPHIGTDRLPGVVKRLREEIAALGGEVRFEARLTGLLVEAGAIRGVEINGTETLAADAVLLAVGHSARDTFELLHRLGVTLERKPFSIGARIEHPQALIDRAQYGRFAGHPALGAADYKLSLRLPDGRGAYTFCMCPGGAVVAAASEPGGVVTNGMSAFARDGVNANSALLVDVRPEDFGGDDPLAGVRFQRRWEEAAYGISGDFRAPAQRAEDFLAGRASRGGGSVTPSYQPGVVWADLRACLPAFAPPAMAAAIRGFDARLKGFALPDAVLTGVETRSSCPLRIPRDESGQASLGGLFPAGEGAGYAGGILSAAVDGTRMAEKAIEVLRRQA